MPAEVAPDLLISHYRIVGSLGAGGMGEVYAGIDETLRRRVALKAIRPERRLDLDAKARFLREARILSQLDHPHICRVYDYIEANGRDWLVLELIEGQTLHHVIRSSPRRVDKLRIAQQIAGVLVVTHAAGVIHRDLKPGNVMIARSGDVKVLDFGLSATVPGGARPTEPTTEAGANETSAEEFIAGAEVGETRLPSAAELAQRTPRLDVSGVYSTIGSVMGTIGYMSPEQARGEGSTSASDMYSFGLVLQELYTSRPPYPETSNAADVLTRAQRGETTPIVGVTGDIRKLIERLTSPIPAQRPTALDAAERLQWIHDAPKRRLRNLVVGSVAAVLLLGAIKYTLDLSRERTAAVAARDEAAQRRDQAETLIGFMLGDLRSKLQQVGRLELLEDVGSKAMAYFGAVPSHALSNEELFRRSQALRQLGELRQARADLPGALQTYRESLRLANDVATRDPNNAEWQLGLAAAHFYVGDVLRRQRELPGAMQEYAAYRDIARRLVDREPANETFLLELSYAHNSVAAVYEAQGNFEEARHELEFSLRLKEQLSQRAPENVERLQALATGHNRLGGVLDRLGEMDSALHHLLADLEIRQRLIARDPRDRSIRRSLVVAHSFVGRAYEDRGDLPAARGQYEAWVSVSAEQVALDPQNAEWARDWARAESVLASARLLTREIDAADAGFLRALKVLRPLATQAATDAARQRDLAAAELGLAQVALERKNHAGVVQQSEVVGRTLAPLAGKGDRDAARLSAEARVVAANALTAMRRDVDAQHELEHALKALTVGAVLPTDKPSLATVVRVLLELGRVDEARPLVTRLQSIGYRHPTFVRAIAATP